MSDVIKSAWERNETARVVANAMWLKIKRHEEKIHFDYKSSLFH